MAKRTDSNEKNDPVKAAQPYSARESLVKHLDEQRGDQGLATAATGNASLATPQASAVGSTPQRLDISVTSVEPGSLTDRFITEPLETPRIVSKQALKMQTRRDFLIYGAGVITAASAFWWLLPSDTQDRILSPAKRAQIDSLQARLGLSSGNKEKFLGRVLTFDDDVAEALYSSDRMVPTYDKAEITPNLRNNYDGQTPDASYIPDWTLALNGLASGKPVTLKINDLLAGYERVDQITRLCCVEGWSAIAWWGGLRFADLIKAFPPAPGMNWVRLDSSVNLDGDGNSDPYYVSIDLATAMHAQTLLATHHDGAPLEVEHGAPLRLIAPMKLGLKNIKAITGITYTATEPPDYWNERGYSKYDGL